ncbi:uncharacterized protein BDV14DRAFT_184054 [Aspergillus stella-maris]|uniref:uncharacterized protein n=1 Tax=Aspergillus stella-maris TaxID=1810926 RepID=UPI003CCD9F30
MYLDAFTTSVTINLNANDTFVPNIYIHNAYNPPNRLNLGLTSLHNALSLADNLHPTAEHIIVGNFNAHNPLFRKPSRWPQRAGREPCPLVETRSLHVTTPWGMVTCPS